MTVWISKIKNVFNRYYDSYIHRFATGPLLFINSDFNIGYSYSLFGFGHRIYIVTSVAYNWIVATITTPNSNGIYIFFIIISFSESVTRAANNLLLWHTLTAVSLSLSVRLSLSLEKPFVVNLFRPTHRGRANEKCGRTQKKRKKYNGDGIKEQ